MEIKDRDQYDVMQQGITATFRWNNSTMTMFQVLSYMLRHTKYLCMKLYDNPGGMKWRNMKETS